MCTEKMIVADAVGKELENLDRCIAVDLELGDTNDFECCLLYTSPSPRDTR